MQTQFTKIYIVRHGESEGNVGIATDHIQGLGSNLSENGKIQAKDVAQKLKDIHFDAAYSSDLARAAQTAEIIALEKNLAVKTTDRIRERSIATYLEKHPGQTRKSLEGEMIKILESLDDKAKMRYKHTEDFESAEESAGRLLTFLREIAVAHPGKTVLIVAHGNIMRSTLTHLGWAKFDELPKTAINNTGYLVLDTDGTDFFVKETHGITKQPDGKRGW